jgi:hypothetical protein
MFAQAACKPDPERKGGCCWLGVQPLAKKSSVAIGGGFGLVRGFLYVVRSGIAGSEVQRSKGGLAANGTKTARGRKGNPNPGRRWRRRSW